MTQQDRDQKPSEKEEQAELNEGERADQPTSSVTPLLDQAGAQFHNGNFQWAKITLSKIQMNQLTTDEKERYELLKYRLSIDPSELWTPIFLLILWLILVYRTLI